MLRLLHIFRVCVIMILGATLCTTTLSMRVESNEFCYVYALAMFVHKFQALDKQNESKNSKKLFFLFTNVLTGLAKRARERHFDSRNRGKKQH